MEQNIVSCPHCGCQFVYDRINGLAQVEIAQSIEARKRMYLRMTMDNMERLFRDPTISVAVVKKVIFDNFNDFTRDVHSILGFGDEAE